MGKKIVKKGSYKAQAGKAGKSHAVVSARGIEVRLEKIEEALSKIDSQIKASMRRQEDMLRAAADAQTREIYSALTKNSGNFDLIQRELANILEILNDALPGPKSSSTAYSRTGEIAKGMHRTPVDRRRGK